MQQDYDIDLAIAMSLAESESKNSENFIAQNKPSSCYSCNKIIYGEGLIAMEKHYHPACFVCYGCGNKLTDQFLPHETDGQIRPYHKSCANELFSKRCYVCSAILSDRYCRHPFLSKYDTNEVELYCVSHLNVQPKCDSCHFPEPLASSHRDSFTHIPNFSKSTFTPRVLCGKCINTAIFTSHEANEVYLEVLEYLNNSMHLPYFASILGNSGNLSIYEVLKRIPVLAVDQSALEDQIPSSIVCSHSGGTRGLTLTSVRQIYHWNNPITSYSNDMYCRSAGTMFPNYENMSMLNVNYIANTEVTAILVLYGLPRHLTASILAHELVHAYLKLVDSFLQSTVSNSSSNIPIAQHVEEGLCQYISYVYLETILEQMALEKSVCARSMPVTPSWEQQLVEYYRYLITMDTSNVYGEGFRCVVNACSSSSFPDVLDRIISQRSV